MSRRARLKARGPYHAAVLPEIAERGFSLPPQVDAAAADALMEITRFDAELSATDLGHQGESAPLAAVLLRTESASSSQIENVTAGAKAPAMATIHEQAGPNAQSVAANVVAMQRAIEMADDLNEDTLLAAHAALMEGHEYAQPGRYRTAQVWIDGAPTPHTATFVPPHTDRIGPAMADLLTFCDRTDLGVLPLVCIAHAQFENIHPFADGNGRMGRALVHVLLKRAGATRRLTVPVSAGLLADTQSYFDALTAYREGDAAPIVERFTEAAFSAVNNGRELNRAISDLYAVWEHHITARRDAAIWRVLPHLIRQPAITVKTVQEATGVSNPAAQNAVDRLVAAGIVTPANGEPAQPRLAGRRGHRGSR
jgi:Fic family protein